MNCIIFSKVNQKSAFQVYELHFCRSLKSNTSKPQTTTSVEDQTTSIKGQTTIDVGSSEKDFMTTISNVAEVPNRNSERCPCPYSGYIAAVFFCVVFSIPTIALAVLCVRKRKCRDERYEGTCKSCFKDMSQKLVAVTSEAVYISAEFFERIITLILRKNYNRITLSTKSKQGAKSFVSCI